MYSEDTATEILERLADGESLAAICRDENMPGEKTVRAWALEDREGFSTRYARARELQAERWADEIVSIGDDVPSDRDAVQRARLRVDTRKWLLSKLLPKKYGDRTEVQHSGYMFNPDDFSREGLQRVKAGEDPQHVLSSGGRKEDT